MASATVQAPGCPCSCPDAGCASPTIVGVVTGCGGLGVPGLPVVAHDATSGGTVLGSTTTDSGGNYTLSGLTGQVIGNSIVIVFAHARFGTQTRTLSYADPFGGFNNQWGCGHSTPTATTSMSTAAAGYHCSSRCAYPLKDTLTLTDGLYGGPVTLTYSAGSWVGSQSASFAGTGGACGSCPAATVTIFYTLDAALLQLQIDVSGGATTPNCPDAGPGTAGSLPVGLSSLTCPPAFSLSGTVLPGSWTAAIVDHLYTCASVTFTVTE